MTQPRHVEEQHRRHELSERLKARGLDPAQIWEPDPDAPRIPLSVLADLVAWLEAYAACPDRKKLEQKGFRFPPVNPDCDPDSDWVKFERWVQRQPLKWNFVREFGALPPPASLSSEALQTELYRIRRILSARGVVLDLEPAVPPSVQYEFLCQYLKENDFEFAAPGSELHLCGCDGDCEGCFQRPWCDSAESV